LELTDGNEQFASAGQRIAAYSNAEILALHAVEFVPIEPMGESLMPSTDAARSRNSGEFRRRYDPARRALRRAGDSFEVMR
jgi:hypothetical protein